MGFKKLIIFSLLATLSIFNLHAENHDAEQNIIEKAKRAPSGGNLQPWRIWLVSGEPLKSFLEDK